MRRAMRHTHLLGASDPVIFKLVKSLIEQMGDAFPELKAQKLIIENTIRDEEIKFKDTLERGMALLTNEINNKASPGVLSGQKAFELYDTYGFPLDLTEDVLKSYGWQVDYQGFDKSMNEQKNKARQAWSGSGDSSYNQEILKSLLNLPTTKFIGYDEIIFETKIDLIIKNNKIIDSASSTDQVDIVCNETIFYAESGGQISDKGIILSKDCSAKILNSKKITVGNGKIIFVSTIEIVSGKITVGDIIKQVIDLDLENKYVHIIQQLIFFMKH